MTKWVETTEYRNFTSEEVKRVQKHVDEYKLPTKQQWYNLVEVKKEIDQMIDKYQEGVITTPNFLEAMASIMYVSRQKDLPEYEYLPMTKVG